MQHNAHKSERAHLLFSYILVLSSMGVLEFLFLVAPIPSHIYISQMYKREDPLRIEIRIGKQLRMEFKQAEQLPVKDNRGSTDGKWQSNAAIPSYLRTKKYLPC